MSIAFTLSNNEHDCLNLQPRHASAGVTSDQVRVHHHRSASCWVQGTGCGTGAEVYDDAEGRNRAEIRLQESWHDECLVMPTLLIQPHLQSLETASPQWSELLGSDALIRLSATPTGGRQCSVQVIGQFRMLTE